MILVINVCKNYDSRCFKKLDAVIANSGVDYKIVKELKDIRGINVQSIIISGSPIRLTQTLSPEDAALINLAITTHLQHPGVPILGICFGFQLLNMLYGGSIQPFGRFVCERHGGLEYCFNDVITKPGIGFKVHKRVRIDGKNVICHVTGPRSRNIVGYLFHSEATDDDKHGYIKRFLRSGHFDIRKIKP